MTSISADTLARLSTSLVFNDPSLTTPDTAWSQHLPFAFWLVEALRPDTFVELGVHTGVSYCAFCQGIAQLALPTAAYGIDTWQGDAQAGAYGDAVLDALRAHHDPLYGGFSHLVRATFDKAQEQFPAGSVDLLHIDGLHTYEAVRHDFEAWLPSASSHGVVLLHDIMERDDDFGVSRLWHEVSGEYPSFAFPFGHGLGVLGVGDELPKPLRWLLLREGRRDGDEAVIRFFSLIGDRLEARAGMARAMRDYLEEKARHKVEEETMRQARDTSQAALSACRAELDACQDELRARRVELAALEASASWRATAPLRSAKRTARKIVGTFLSGAPE